MREPKKMGRPRVLPENRKRHVKVVRLNDATLDKLEAAASECQRSLSEEIEARILQSFDQPALIDALAKRLLVQMFPVRRAGRDLAEDTPPTVTVVHSPALDEA